MSDGPQALLPEQYHQLAQQIRALAAVQSDEQRFAVETDKRTLADAVRGADVFYGLSVANVLTPDMVKFSSSSL